MPFDCLVTVPFVEGVVILKNYFRKQEVRMLDTDWVTHETVLPVNNVKFTDFHVQHACMAKCNEIGEGFAYNIHVLYIPLLSISQRGSTIGGHAFHKLPYFVPAKPQTTFVFS